MRSWLALALLFSACAPVHETGGSGEQVWDTRCRTDLEVSPEELDFGTVPVGPISPSATVTLTATPCWEVAIWDLELQDPDAPFLLGRVGTVIIPAGQGTSFDVRFEPVVGAWATKVLIDSSDWEEPTHTVVLRGEGVL